jgi:CRP-like cAMP-binding protein
MTLVSRKIRPTTSPIQRTLDKVPILAGLPEAARRDLEKRCTWREFKAREQIIDKDSDSRDVFFIVHGAVRVLNFSYSGREVSYDDIRAGGMFGELAGIDGKPRSATVIALRRTLVASFSPELFRSVMKAHPDFAISVIERLAAIIRSANDRIMDLSTLGAFSRVYAELLRLARRANKVDGDGARLDPIPVHSDLAARCGTTRETVARAFGELAKKGVAQKVGNALVISSMDALEDIVEGGEE